MAIAANDLQALALCSTRSQEPWNVKRESASGLRPCTCQAAGSARNWQA